MVMNFPVIRTIDDVLPAIKGHDEFFVAEREFGSVVNYMVSLPDSFTCPIRRECRGIIFYPDGRIMSRPYHKFFNLGEKEETRPENLDFTNVLPTVMDKLDGSMIRPIWFDDGAFFELGTKMGVTDVAKQAFEWLRADTQRFTSYNNFMHDCEDLNTTPIFEWCSRKQRIVVDYPEEQLILTGLRNKISGAYFSHFQIEQVAGNYHIPVVDTPDIPTLYRLIASAAEERDKEGWVVAWPNGHRVKIKLDWYVDLHKAKECIAREKYVIEMILSETIDDLKGKLQEQDLVEVNRFEEEFLDGVSSMMMNARNIFERLMKNHEDESDVLRKYINYEPMKAALRKNMAMNIQQQPSWMQPILFGCFDGKYSPADGVWEQLKKLTKTQPMIDKNRHLWGGAKYTYGGTLDE